LKGGIGRMEISFLSKNKNVQNQKINDATSDPMRNISSEENKKYTDKNQVDTAEISASHSGSFDDKKIMIAKSAILYDVSVSTSTQNIENLKKAIDSGSYNVPANLLADAIIK